MHDASAAQQDLASIKAEIQAGKFADAEARAQALLARPVRDSTAETELLYMLAVAQRYQDKHQPALLTQAKLIETAPGYARIYQERGHTLLSLNRLTDAQRAYEKAVNLNPALVASWKALLNLYELHDRDLNTTVHRHKARANEALEYLLSLPAELVTVNSFIHEGKLYAADQLCRQFLRNNKTHIEGMRLLAKIGEEIGILMDAEFLLETALELSPANRRVRFDYANLLLKMQKFEKAHVQTEALMAADADNHAYRALHANALAGIGDQQGAIDAYNQVINRSPGQNALLVMRGHAEKTIGRIDEAVASYRAAYGVKPSHGDAYWSLANTKSYQFTDAEMASMREQEARADTSMDDRVHLCFALGKAYEDAGDFSASFEYYARGNALKQASVRHRPEYLAIRARAQMAVCTEAFFEARSECGHKDAAPIFVVGLPRAGSTLIEQILASHSQVDGTMELPNVIALAQRLRGNTPTQVDAAGREQPRYPQILAEIDPDYFRRFGEQFIQDTMIYRGQAPYFIDKNPNNFFHIGLIRLMLPHAKVIDARRHPMSCCFSGFKQLFGQGQEFSYGLHEIGNYYREYVDLMEHWDRVLPGFVLRVQHEQLLDDLEGQVRRMLDFCGLDFEQDCLEFYNTERSVRTPSSEQVRQPIFKTSLETWKHYEPWLDPLKKALGPKVRAQFDIH